MIIFKTYIKKVLEKPLLAAASEVNLKYFLEKWDICSKKNESKNDKQQLLNSKSASGITELNNANYKILKTAFFTDLIYYIPRQIILLKKRVLIYWARKD